MNPASARVLVVDDVADNRDILVRRLGRLGISLVEQATNGREALEAIARQTFDLILLDIMMPEMDGFEVLQNLKAQDKLVDLPVIVISALTDLDPVVRCIELGAEDFILKPFNATLLRARILSTLEKKKLRDAMREELARKQEELNDARALQLALVPADYRGSHHGRLVSIDIVLEPAKELGGDLADYFLIGNDLIVTLLGDVSGKGAGAALMMARTQALFRALSMREDALEIFGATERAANLVNAVLSRDNHSCMFVTMLLTVLEVKSGRLACVRAGHVAPFLIDGAGVVQRLLPDTTLPLGLYEGDHYRSTVIELQAGDELLIVTDGVTEAMNAADELFGEPRVGEFMAACAGDGMLGRLVAQVRQFEAGLAPSDDLAAIHLRIDATDRQR
jgi:sigma-B regulation protein RsbU (phosphoserine phosphatase)